ncbi:alpha/beta fold hydrolase [Hydrogenophaga sp. OTU3427]|uniref:alpha/beta fold hydrolase n=1 Tax=Hydrogenophaga sp. OTU3427 TaxID=3043856 RepID=UPI00313E64AA
MPSPALPPHIALDGVTLEVRHIDGASDLAPLVFLHEGLGSVSLWTQRGRDWPQALCAATGRAGWLYSRRGYGRSDPIPDVRGEHRAAPPNGLWSSGRHTTHYMHHEAWRVLPRLLQALRVERPVLVGHSDGATIALLHAARRPVAGCVVMAPHLMIEDIALKAIAEARETYLASGGQQGLRSRLARHHADVDNAFWQWNDIWLSEAFRAFDIRAICRDIAGPLLAVQGLKDEYGTLAQLDAVAQAVPQAQRLELPDCGHSPHRDQFDALTERVMAFVSGLA